MIVVDSSVWIDIIKNRSTTETATFDRLLGVEPFGLGDLILYEVLSGVTPQTQYDMVKQQLQNFAIYTLCGEVAALEATENSRFLRSRGIQVATVDCLIATFCIKNGFKLLSSDKHFVPFIQYLGLQIV